MKALEDLSVRDTNVSLPMLADILKICPKIIRLDFSFRFEEEWENYGPKKALLDSLDHSFKKAQVPEDTHLRARSQRLSS